MIIKSGLVLQPDGTAKQQDILIRDGKIAGLDAAAGVDDEVLDARDRLIAPGLINTHCHSNENFYRARFDNMPLEIWLLWSYPLFASPVQTPREIYVRTMLGCIEMLRSGCTTVVDFLYEMPEMTTETVAAVMQAYRDSGMRVLLAVGIADKIYYETTPIAMELLPVDLRAEMDAAPLPTPEENLALVDAVRQQWHGVDGRLAVGVAPSGPQRCSDRQLELSADYARRHDLRIHIHTLETKMQAFTGHRLYHKTIIEHLADLGFLSERVSLNHAIWLTERDVDLVAERGAMTTHNLLSNLKLGSGISPVPEMLDLGIDVSLGTDGMSSNDSQDMYEVLKAAALMHKVRQPEFDVWLGAAEAWRMATIAGARSAGFGGQVGEIREGQRADLTLFDLNSIPFTPFNTPINHLVYCMPSRAVDTVLVEGRVVVRDGRMATVNESDLLREARELGRDYIERCGPQWDASARMQPSVARGYRRAVGHDVGVRRHTGHLRS